MGLEDGDVVPEVFELIDTHKVVVDAEARLLEMLYSLPFFDSSLDTNCARYQSLILVNSQVIRQHHTAHTAPNSVGLRRLDLVKDVFHRLFEIIDAHRIVQLGSDQVSPALPPEANHTNIIPSFFKCLIHNSLQIHALVRPNLP